MAETLTVNTLEPLFTWVAISQTLCYVSMKKNFERQQKGYEVETPIWNRWELVLKHEKANDFVTRYLVEDGYSFGGLFKGILTELNTLCRAWRGYEQKQMADLRLVD